MIYRCLWPSNSIYANYGGKGIRVHDAWQSFEAFLGDMGPCPKGSQLGRRDVKGHYTPDNTRWMTRSQAQRARGIGSRLSFAGEALTVIEWSERVGLSANTIRCRLRKGWTVGEALGLEAAPGCLQVGGGRSTLEDGHRSDPEQ